MFIAPLISLVTLIQPMILKPDIKDGEVIKSLRLVKVLVQSEPIVTQVEMYVDGDLRDTETSTPYTFTLDPLTEKEGNEKLTFTAYNTSGQKASISVNVTIDSGASQGAAANASQAQDLLSQSKYDDAIYRARVALKVDPKCVPAELVLSRAFLDKGVYDKAEEFAEDALANQPDSPDALNTISAIQLKRAFNSVAVGGDRNQMLISMGEAISKAIDARQKVLDKQFDSLPAPSNSTYEAYADGAFQCQNFSAAISALTPAFNNSSKTELGDRIAYAQLRLGRMGDLLQTLTLMKSANTLDAYSYAVWAALDEFSGDKKGADDNIKNALLEGGTGTGVQTAQIYIALHRGDIATMSQLVAALAANQGQLPEVNYYLSILGDRQGNFELTDQAFQDCILAEPLFYPMYLERGTEALKRALGQQNDPNKSYDLDTAGRMYNAALQAKPDSPEALTALAVLDLNSQPQKLNDALKMTTDAIAADPGYATAHYAASTIYSAVWLNLGDQADQLRQDANGSLDAETLQKIDDIKTQAAAATQKSNDELKKAQDLDPARLEGTSIPRSLDIYHYFVIYGALPILTPPK